MGLVLSLRWNRIATTTNAIRASPPRTPPTIAPVLFDGLGVTFESVDDEAEAEEMIDVVKIGDDEAEAEEMINVVDIGDDEVAEDVEDADVTDGLGPLRAEVLAVLEGSEVVVGEYNKLSVTGALPQAIYE